MIRLIVKDPLFLAQPSLPASPFDVQTAQDLLDTLRAHADACVGMAANMIGIRIRILAYRDGSKYDVMFNPRILWGKDAYEAEEGCLSLSGERRVKRWRSICVSYHTMEFQQRTEVFVGFTAQILQHEIDHFDGVLI